MNFVFHFAYLDPGTGSLIIQSLIGAIAGIAVFGRRILASIKLKFKRDQPKSSDNTTK
jgi:hypothetical protein